MAVSDLYLLISSQKLLLLFAILVLTVFSGLEASHNYQYSKESCVSLIPVHHTEISEEHQHGSNHVENNSSTTTIPPSTEAEPPIPIATDTEIAQYDMKVHISENGYRRLKKLTVTITSNDTYDGYMLQARIKGDTTTVGYFIRPVMPRHSMSMICRNTTGEDKATKMEHDTIMSDASEGVRYGDKPLIINWMAPEDVTEEIEFKFSVMGKNSGWYTTYLSATLPLKHFPPSTRECALTKSCYRYCVKGPNNNCMPHNARYMATFEYNNETKTEITIVVGGQLTGTKGYLAIGFSNDHKHMRDTDIAACYLKDNETVGIQHLLLQTIKDGVLDISQGDLALDKSDIDGDYVWCQFTREISAENDEHNNLDLTKPTFFYYFWGPKDQNNDKKFYLPPRYQIKGSKTAIKYESNAFNVIHSSAGAQGIKHATVVAAIVLSLAHFLYC